MSTKENVRQAVKLFDEDVRQTERRDMGRNCRSVVRAEIVYRKGTDNPFHASKRGFRLHVFAVTTSDLDERGIAWEVVALDIGGRYRTDLTEFVREVKMFSTKTMAELANDPVLVQHAKDLAQSVALAEQARVRQVREQEENALGRAV